MKDKRIATLLWLLGFAGLCGLHRIYLRRRWGIVWLATLGLFFVGQLVDGLLLAQWTDGADRHDDEGWTCRSRRGATGVRDAPVVIVQVAPPVMDRAVAGWMLRRDPGATRCSFCGSRVSPSAGRCDGCAAIL